MIKYAMRNPFLAYAIEVIISISVLLNLIIIELPFTGNFVSATIITLASSPWHIILELLAIPAAITLFGLIYKMRGVRWLFFRRINTATTAFTLFALGVYIILAPGVLTLAGILFITIACISAALHVNLKVADEESG